MKRFCIFIIGLLFFGIGSAIAQDLIILKDGNIIEAKITEISTTEIRYKRFTHLDGPTVVISAADVLSIRYENGTSETINAAPATAQRNTMAGQRNTQIEAVHTTAIDPDKFIFGINGNPAGWLNYLWEGTGAGPSVNVELGKGNFNSEIHLMFPLFGFGVLGTFNYFWPSKIGGAYLGGGIGLGFYEDSYTEAYSQAYYSGYGTSYRIAYRTAYYTAFSLTVGANAGYKFVTRSGVYFRTGSFVGFDFGCLWNRGWTLPVYFKPDLAIGWTMR